MGRMKIDLNRIEKDLDKLEVEVRERVKAMGPSEASRKLGVNKSYLSRFVNGKQTISAKQLIEMLRELNSES